MSNLYKCVKLNFVPYIFYQFQHAYDIQVSCTNELNQVLLLLPFVQVREQRQVYLFSLPILPFGIKICGQGNVTET
jgi:hypothetical protein